MVFRAVRDKIRYYLNHQGFMKYSKNTAWLFSEKLLRIIAGLAVGIWVARYLGPEKYGILAYAESFVAIFAAFISLGLNNLLVRELLNNEDERDVLMGSAFWIKFLGGLTQLLLIVIISYFIGNDPVTNLMIIIIAVASIFQSLNVITFYFQATVESRYTVMANIIAMLASCGWKILLILNKASLIWFSISFFIEYLLIGLGILYFYRRKGLRVGDWSIRFDKARYLLRKSWPLLLAGLTGSLYMEIDKVMLKFMTSAADVGQYAVAAKISTLWYFVPIIISTSLFPAIINAKKRDKKLYLDRMQNLYDLMVFLGLAIAIPVTLLGKWLIVLLYGAEYSLAGPALIIHIWAGIFVFMGFAYSRWLIAEDFIMKVFYRNVFGIIANILINLALIPIYGIIGAAIATIMGHFFANIMYDIFDKETRVALKQKLNSLLLHRLTHVRFRMT